MRTGTWSWSDNTDPFSAIGERPGPALFVVRQIGDRDFTIAEGTGFRYRPAVGPPIDVTSETLPKTDFASIPRFMSWLVSRHGRHTPAALVHDQQVVDGMPFAERIAADRRFLEMMDALEVPPVQSRLMWAAVTLATRWRGPLASKVAIVVWGASAGGGMHLLVRGICHREPRMVAAALAAPAAAAGLWGRQYWAGVVGGYALPLVVVPAATSFVFWGGYWALETAVRLTRSLLPHNESEELPPPVGYQGR